MTSPAASFPGGILVIDKPAGPTSHDVVAIVRRAFGGEKVGHTGTLDPLATGVLPLVVGRATRLAAFMTSDDKEYVARIKFGTSTTTYDAAGEPTDDIPAETRKSPPEDRAAIDEALGAFRGTYLQRPPAFSAKKIAGTPAYKLARADRPVEIAPVEVTVSALALEGYENGVADVQLTCSSGFYVRTLAHELGQRLGCGAFLEGLRRTRAGDFGLDRAHTLEAVIAAGADAGRFAIPMGDVLTKVPSVVLTAAGVARAGHGNGLRPADWGGGSPDSLTAPRVRMLDEAGGLVGIAELRPGGLLQPVVVLV